MTESPAHNNIIGFI